VLGTVDGGYRGELLSEAAALVPDVLAELERRHLAVIEGIVDSAREDASLPADPISAAEAAHVLYDALTGISQAGAPASQLRRRLRAAVDVVVCALTGGGGG
jgi:hypothetical protein